MIIEIRKAGFVNKGAELMLHAVLQRMKNEYTDIKFVISPSSNAPFLKRAELGLFQKMSPGRSPFWGKSLELITPKKWRDDYGIVLESEIDTIIDIAGFAYGDQWGEKSCKKLADNCRRWKKAGKKVVFMPQAFGPFSSSKIKSYIQTVADNADLIFAREQISYKHIVAVTGDRENIKIAPDFTNLVEGVLPDNFDKNNLRIALVPNYRMIDKVPKDQSDAYLPLMTTCAKHLLENNKKPFILIHEGIKDRQLAEKIRNCVDYDLPVITEENPLKIKGILGACEATIGSRFHGLVSALSQGIPSLATGWSHKYKMLFEDYGFSDGLLDVSMSADQIQKKVDLIIDNETRDSIIKTLVTNSTLLKNQSQAMWQEIFSHFK